MEAGQPLEVRSTLIVNSLSRRRLNGLQVLLIITAFRLDPPLGTDHRRVPPYHTVSLTRQLPDKWHTVIPLDIRCWREPNTPGSIIQEQLAQETTMCRDLAKVRGYNIMCAP
jgi:hypothetical protein